MADRSVRVNETFTDQNYSIISYFKLFLRPYITLFFKPVTILSIQCYTTMKLYQPRPPTLDSTHFLLCRMPQEAQEVGYPWNALLPLGNKIG